MRSKKKTYLVSHPSTFMKFPKFARWMPLAVAVLIVFINPYIFYLLKWEFSMCEGVCHHFCVLSLLHQMFREHIEETLALRKIEVGLLVVLAKEDTKKASCLRHVQALTAKMRNYQALQIEFCMFLQIFQLY